MNAPTSTTVNTATSVTVNVSNTGNQTASGFTLSLNDGATFVGSQNVPSLAAGGSTALTFNWSASTTGGHTLTGALGQTDANTANNTAQASTNVMQPSTSVISLTATARKNKTKRYVDLQWSGAAGSSIVITRTGSSGKTLTTTNDGLYTDAVNVGTYSYKVCESTAGGACSPTVSVTVN